MKVLLIALSIVSYCFAAEFQYPRQFRFDNNESVESVNERIMERLRQEAGSERGVYHVYLPDGRLQRVEYTAAPINAQQEQKQYQDFLGNYANSQQTVASDVGVDSVRNVYYVEVPAERLEKLREAQAAYYQQLEFQRQQNYREPQTGRPAAYSQPLEVKAQFVPLQVVTTDKFSLFNEQH